VPELLDENRDWSNEVDVYALRMAGINATHLDHDGESIRALGVEPQKQPLISVNNHRRIPLS
jgi:hypothetical protein